MTVIGLVVSLFVRDMFHSIVNVCGEGKIGLFIKNLLSALTENYTCKWN
jgi:hypothetical protein